MNENIDLTKILENCPKGWEFYSCAYGKVRFERLYSGDFPVEVELSDSLKEVFSREGKITNLPGSECCLFPSREQRDWSKFSAPWYKKEKFDPKTLQPFDKVLVRYRYAWRCELLSHYKEYKGKIDFYCTNVDYVYSYCIPYNEDTKHLVDTTDEAPEYYKYWED